MVEFSVWSWIFEFMLRKSFHYIGLTLWASGVTVVTRSRTLEWGKWGALFRGMVQFVRFVTINCQVFNVTFVAHKKDWTTTKPASSEPHCETTIIKLRGSNVLYWQSRTQIVRFVVCGFISMKVGCMRRGFARTSICNVICVKLRGSNVLYWQSRI